MNAPRPIDRIGGAATAAPPQNARVSPNAAKKYDADYRIASSSWRRRKTAALIANCSATPRRAAQALLCPNGVTAAWILWCASCGDVYGTILRRVARCLVCVSSSVLFCSAPIDPVFERAIGMSVCPAQELRKGQTVEERAGNPVHLPPYRSRRPTAPL